MSRMGRMFHEMSSMEKLREHAEMINGVWRWKSNGRVPFDDLLYEAGVSPAVREACRVARDRENAEAIEEYRRARKGRVPSQEELFEMRAAFGPDARIVNVLTGEKYRT
jgi:hypothetical protein